MCLISKAMENTLWILKIGFNLDSKQNNHKSKALGYEKDTQESNLFKSNLNQPQN